MSIPRWAATTALAAMLQSSLTVSDSLARTPESAEAVFQATRAYTVRIRTQIAAPFIEDEQGAFEGAGFLVDAGRGWIVTNAHVVGQSPTEVQVAFAGEAYRPARRLYVDSFADMAVLEIDMAGRSRPTAKLVCGPLPEAGEAVGAFGHPLGLPFTGTRGIVSGHTSQAVADLIQIDATVDHGNSGGPVMRLLDGRVVGIATAGAGGDKSDRVNFATPMPDVCRILELLRDGIPPDPPQLGIALLLDEDGNHTLEVARSFDEARWPLRGGDRIVRVGRGADTLETLHQLVTALRGRTGRVPVEVAREGKRVVVEVSPEPRAPIVGRRGVRLDGALIAPMSFEDGAVLGERTPLTVHSVESGSSAESHGMQRGDLLESVDGRHFDALEALTEYLQQPRDGAPLRAVVRRWSPQTRRMFDYCGLELPGSEIEMIGPGARLLSGEAH
jgi:S1-C subfamily serine protease